MPRISGLCSIAFGVYRERNGCPEQCVGAVEVCGVGWRRLVSLAIGEVVCYLCCGE